jgi:hypothetical protein
MYGLTSGEGIAATNEAFDNAAPLRAMWLDSASLLTQLEECDFLCVMVDDQLKLRRDFMKELREGLPEEEEE